ncbi:transglycosylase domain-containing protein [Thiofilum flexile]|uniref:transglycosylase domain-containing protein n=1 Tax=Thiofilum flexile TaxID=125627 RepID=UPI000363475A|nr:transglycosylase domain-containing protein [Thiofilum flexile]
MSNSYWSLKKHGHSLKIKELVYLSKLKLKKISNSIEEEIWLRSLRSSQNESNLYGKIVLPTKYIINTFDTSLLLLKEFFQLGTTTLLTPVKLPREAKIPPPRTIRRPSWLTYTAIVLILILALPILLILVQLMYLSSPPNEANKKFLLKLHQYRTAIAVRDTKNNLIGIMPSNKKSPDNFIDHDKDGEYKISLNRPESLYVDEIPDFFWRVLKQREGRNISFNNSSLHSYKGIDLVSSLKILIGKGGGSSPMNLITKTLYGSSYFEIERNRSKECGFPLNKSAKLCRKLVEYRSAKDLFPYLAKNDGQEFKRWSAMHVPIITGVHGDLIGIQAASAVLFGKKPSDLNLAQQAILAAAYYQPLLFRGDSEKVSVSGEEYKALRSFCKDKENNPDEQKSLPLTLTTILEEKNKDLLNSSPNDLCIIQKTNIPNQRWRNRINAARKVIEMMGDQISAMERNIIDNQFSQLEDAPFYPEIPSDLKEFFYEDGDKNEKTDRTKIYANLSSRLDYFANGLKDLIRINLVKMGLDDSESISEIRLSLPLADDYKFRRNIDNALAKLSNNFKFNKFLPLNKENPKDHNNASIRVSVSDIKGNLVRYYRREGASAIEQKIGLNKPLRPIASIAKIPALLYLLSKGDKLDTKYCNEYYHGRANAGRDKGVQDCSVKFTLLETIAQSKNLPLIWALNKKRPSHNEIDALYSNLAITNENGKDINAKLEDMSFGSLMETPSYTHDLIDSVMSFIAGKNDGHEIHLINQTTIVHYDNDLQTEAKNNDYLSGNKNHKNNNPISPIQIDKYITTQEQKEMLLKALESPITHPKGTLHFATKLKGGKVIIGKTGTYDTDARNIKDKYAIGSLKINDKIYTFSILVGSEDYAGDGLIKSIRSEDIFKPILQEIINSFK